jgi:hypothetical protein
MKHPKNKTCRKGTHRFDLDRGRVCSRCGVRRIHMPGVPKLLPLRYGSVYCELCRRTLEAGDRVAFWMVDAGKGKRLAAYCADCHHANVEHGRPLR